MRLKTQSVALLVVAGLFAAACAGSDPTSQAVGAEASESVVPVQSDQQGSDNPTSVAHSVRRELSLVLQPESNVPTNLLPDVEVHDVGQDRMVNFRNIFPAERPVLLWMWAPY